MDLIILLVTLVITIGADLFVKLKYKQTSKISNSKNITGKEVARKILDNNGLTNVKVQMVSGILSDHYNPGDKTVNLSEEVYSDTSIAALSVASHECGHAIQDKEGYFFLRIRSMIFPLVNIASKLGYVAIMIGFIASLTKLIWLGIIAEFVILAFQLVTLPVEFNASKRALKQIKKLNIANTKDLNKARGMLIAAALTYVASVANSVLQILRLVISINNRNNR